MASFSKCLVSFCIILFREWPCKGEFAQTLVKITHNETLFLPLKFRINETNFDGTCGISIYLVSIVILPETSSIFVYSKYFFFFFDYFNENY